MIKKIVSLSVVLLLSLNMSSFAHANYTELHSPYYQAVAEVNEEYGTNFAISYFDDHITITPTELKEQLKSIAMMDSTKLTPTTSTVTLALPKTRDSGPYYDIVSVRISSYFYINVEVAYKIATNGNDLYFIQNTSDDRYTFSPAIPTVGGYVDVISYNDYISGDKSEVFIDLHADCYISSGGIIVFLETLDNTYQIHINDVE